MCVINWRGSAKDIHSERLEILRRLMNDMVEGKGKVIALQARCGPEGG